MHQTLNFFKANKNRKGEITFLTGALLLAFSSAAHSETHMQMSARNDFRKAENIKLFWPVRGATLDIHAGEVNFRTRTRSPVRAAISGVVTKITTDQRGKNVIIENTEQEQGVYRHLQDVSVVEGANITAGQQLAMSQKQGSFSFTLFIAGRTTDPILFMDSSLDLPADEFLENAKNFSADENLAQAKRALQSGAYFETRKLLADCIRVEEDAHGYGSKHLAELLFMMATVYRNEKNYQDALSAIDQANDIAIALSDDYLVSIGWADYLISIGWTQKAAIYDVQGNFDSALPLFEKSLQYILMAIDKPNREGNNDVLNAYWNVAHSQLMLGKLDNAKRTLKSAFDYVDEKADDSNANDIYDLMIDLLIRTKEYAAAERIIERRAMIGLANSELENARVLINKYQYFYRGDEKDKAIVFAQSANKELRGILKSKTPTRAAIYYYLYSQKITSSFEIDDRRYFKILFDRSSEDEEDQFVNGLTLDSLYVDFLHVTCKSPCDLLLGAEGRLAVQLERHDSKDEMRQLVDRVQSALTSKKIIPKAADVSSLINIANAADALEDWRGGLFFIEQAKSTIARLSLPPDAWRDVRLIAEYSIAKARLEPANANDILLDAAQEIRRYHGVLERNIAGISLLLGYAVDVNRDLAATIAEIGAPLWEGVKIEGRHYITWTQFLGIESVFYGALINSSRSSALIPISRKMIDLAAAQGKNEAADHLSAVMGIPRKMIHLGAEVGNGSEDAYIIAKKIVLIDELLKLKHYEAALAEVKASLRIVRFRDSYVNPKFKDIDSDGVVGRYTMACGLAAIDGGSLGAGIPITRALKKALAGQLLRAADGVQASGKNLSSDDLKVIFEAMQLLASASLGKSTARAIEKIAINDHQLAQLMKRREQYVNLWDAANEKLYSDALAIASGTVDWTLHRETLDRRMKIAQSIDGLEAEINAMSPNMIEANSSETISEVTKKLAEGELLIWIIDADNEAFALELKRNAARLRKMGVSVDMAQEDFSKLKAGWTSNVAALRENETPKTFNLDASFRSFRRLFGEDGGELAGVTSITLVQTVVTEELNLGLIANPNGSSYKGDGDFRSVNWLVKDFAFRTVAGVGEIAKRVQWIFKQAEPSVLEIGEAIPSLAGTDGRTSQLSSFPPLPDTLDELNKIASVINTHRELLVANNATKGKVLQKLMGSTYDVVIFATHGLRYGEMRGLTEPALLLSRGNDGSEMGSLLTSSEVSALTMHSRVVVLSACNTASDNGSLNSERFSGLVLSFLSAGALEVVATDWSLYSKTAAVVTVPFIKSVVTRSFRSEKALSESMKALIMSENGKYSHPYYWASFLLVGPGSL